jgi:hypothetical protein
MAMTDEECGPKNPRCGKKKYVGRGKVRLKKVAKAVAKAAGTALIGTAAYLGAKETGLIKKKGGAVKKKK